MGTHGRENWSGFFLTVVSGQAACRGGQRGRLALAASISAQASPSVRARKEPHRGRSSRHGLRRSAVLPGTGAAKPVPNDLISFLLLETCLSVTRCLPLRASF